MNDIDNILIPYRKGGVKTPSFLTGFTFSMVRVRSFGIALFLIDKVEVSKVDDRVEEIGSDEDRIHLPSSIGQEDQSSSQTEVSKSHGDNTFFPLFRSDPLDDEPHRKHRLSNKTEEHPEVKLKLWISQR